MALMALCAVLLLAGVAAVVLWGGDEVREPPSDDAGRQRSAADAARRYTWDVILAVASGVGAGLLVAGAGGRLAMRLLAAMAGEGAQGRVTEADEIVGQISAGGTLGFMVLSWSWRSWAPWSSRCADAWPGWPRPCAPRRRSSPGGSSWRRSAWLRCPGACRRPPTSPRANRSAPRAGTGK